MMTTLPMTTHINITPDIVIMDKEYDAARARKWRQENPEKWRATLKKSHDKRVTFKGEYITLQENPRKGVCSKCGGLGKTAIHHEKYDDNNPLNNTVELCLSCHRSLHNKIRIENNTLTLIKRGVESPNWKGDNVKPQSLYKRKWRDDRRKRGLPE